MDFTEAYSDRCSAVGLAARVGDVKELRRLIQKGYSVDVPDNRGWMPIHEAASHNTSECLKLLIRAAPSDSYIRTKTFEGTSPLHLSAIRGSLKSAAVLLESGADPNELTDDETFPLFLAVGNGNIDMVKLLLQHGANINGSHCWSEWNSLHQASFQGYPEILKLLLDHGANTESKDDFMITPLFIAAQYGRLECLRILTSYGGNVNCQANDQATSLFIAAQEGHGECVELLLSKGADPNLFCNEEEWHLPIHAAAQMGHTNILRMLIPVTDRLCGTAEGKVSPLYSAIYGEHEDCLELLLKEGYSPDGQPCSVFDCRSPMALAIKKGNRLGLTRLLLKYGIAPLETDLGLCLQHRAFSLFQYLLKRGCNLPSREHMDVFSRHAISAEGEYEEWLPSLLLSGFDPVNLLRTIWASSARSKVLALLLEFTNWRRLPSEVEYILSCHKECFTPAFPHHFGLPSLSHLCRLEIRSHLASHRSQLDRFIRQLPLPTCLQDFLLYSDILRTYAIPEGSLRLWEEYEGNAVLPVSASENTECRET